MSSRGAGVSWRRPCLLALAILAPAAARAGEAYSGFTHCAPPMRPACVDAPGPEAACDAEVQAFVTLVFQYRACLQIETERAVRDANEVIDAWRCHTDKKKCRH